MKNMLQNIPPPKRRKITVETAKILRKLQREEKDNKIRLDALLHCG